MTRIVVYAATHRGLVRPHNEDTLGVAGWLSSGADVEPTCITVDRRGPAFAAVADGLGGHAAGAEASRLAMSALAENARSLVGTRIREVLDEVNVAVHAYGVSHPHAAGAGSTVAGLSIDSDVGWIFNVGDSRVYRLMDGYAGVVTVDDRPPRAPGQPEDAATHVLSQCLGGTQQLRQLSPHLLREPVSQGDRFLLCSDGLSDVLPNSAIGKLAAGDSWGPRVP
jgi:serine/threonine protein phosphatase PrpC